MRGIWRARAQGRGDGRLVSKHLQGGVCRRGKPLVSILIPNKDHADDLRKALTSIFTKTAYPNYEVLVVENNSVEPATFDYYRELQKQHPNCRVVTYEGGFNFSAINNFGRKAARGEYLLLLNNDVEVINGTWLGEMLALCAQRAWASWARSCIIRTIPSSTRA